MQKNQPTKAYLSNTLPFLENTAPMAGAMNVRFPYIAGRGRPAGPVRSVGVAAAGTSKGGECASCRNAARRESRGGLMG